MEDLAKQKTRLFKSAKFCDYCGKKLSRVRRGGPDYPSLEHTFPKSRGGTDSMDNIVVVCCRCNQIKGQDTFPEFLERIISIYKHLTNS